MHAKDKVSRADYEKITAMAEKAASKSKDARKGSRSNSKGRGKGGGKSKGKGGDRKFFVIADGTKIPICCRDFRTTGSCPAGNVDKCAKGRHLSQAQYEDEKSKLNK